MTNALAQESSPYLQQHAENPVNWLPWSKNALDLAKKEGKPILLSIGYSACHWCHVMAHESFENDDTARLMNKYFINIKVDREERPDIDKIYQTAHQLMANRPGGWPLTMFLSPDDQVPFFGGTYFPDTPKFGMMSFSDLLERIADVYREQPDQVRQHTESMQQALSNLALQDNINQSIAEIETLQNFDSQLLKIYDSEHGGFGQAPKFPQPAMLKQAIRRAFVVTESHELYEALDFSLQKLALGGIQDHLAGGFYRYSVDDQWMIPHFEKMLYDNGQLLCVFALMFELNENPIYQQAVEGIVWWLKSEMQSNSGLFYAALDADSEGVEGKFYLWTPGEVEALVDSDFFPLFSYKFGLDQPANFEGQWHLHAYYNDQAVADKFDSKPELVRSNQLEARTTLLKKRSERIRPGLDNKILTAWNALVIQGLATSARVFNNHEDYQTARRCLNALQNECWYEERLLAMSHQSGKRLPAYLDDYAYLLQATLDCLRYQWNSEDLKFAIVLSNQLLEFFEDRDHGGFYFTANDHEVLIQRPKSWQDEAMPNGNAIAAHAIYQLGLLVGSIEYTRAAEKSLQSVADNVNHNPLYASGFLGLLEDSLKPPCLVIVRGEFGELGHWREQLLPGLAHNQIAYFIPADTDDLPEILAEKNPGSETTAWICRGLSCEPPVKDLNQLLSHAVLTEQYQTPDND